MSLHCRLLVGFTFLVLAMAQALSQPPGDQGKGKKAPNEAEEIYKALRKAYESPEEREARILKELRKAYVAPSPEQEEKIFRELRKAYDVTEEDESRILRELRKAYQSPSEEQEARIIREIRRAPLIPPGVLVRDPKRGDGLFRRLDRNGDGVLSFDEMTDELRAQRNRWDANRDGFIDQGEFQAYFDGRVQRTLAEGGFIRDPASGGLDRSLPGEVAEQKPVVFRPGKLPQELPSWFEQLDTDRDGQIGLYEWRKSGRPLREFSSFDRNNDGFITAQEMVYYFAQANKQAEHNGSYANQGNYDFASGKATKPKGPRPDKGPKGKKKVDR